MAKGKSILSVKCYSDMKLVYQKLHCGLVLAGRCFVVVWRFFLIEYILLLAKFFIIISAHLL